MNDFFGLTTFERIMFNKTHRRHLQALGKSEKLKHRVENIKDIKRNFKEECFEVHYQHEWYKYYLNGEWG